MHGPTFGDGRGRNVFGRGPSDDVMPVRLAGVPFGRCFRPPCLSVKERTIEFVSVLLLRRDAE